MQAVAAGEAARATASTTRASCSRPGRCRPSAADALARPASVSASELAGGCRPPTRRTAPSAAGSPRVSRKSRRCSRCSSHAVQVLRRSGRVQLRVVPRQHPGRASRGSPWPSRSASVGRRCLDVMRRAAPRGGAMPGSHGGSRPASRSLRAARVGRRPAARRSAASIARIRVTSAPGPSERAAVVGEVRVGQSIAPFAAAVGEAPPTCTAGPGPARRSPSAASRGSRRRGRSTRCGRPSRPGSAGSGRRRPPGPRGAHR